MTHLLIADWLVKGLSRKGMCLTMVLLTRLENCELVHSATILHWLQPQLHEHVVVGKRFAGTSNRVLDESILNRAKGTYAVHPSNWVRRSHTVCEPQGF